MTKEWFEDKAFWVELYPFMFPEGRIRGAAEEVEKLLKLAGCAGGAVLDLCCGPGRHSIELARKGFQVTGVDRTEFLLEKAKEASAAQNLKIEWVLDDMKDFCRPAAFDLAISMFSSFGYFREPEANAEVLRNICESLKPGGLLVMDLKGKETFVPNFREVMCTDGADGSVLLQRHKPAADWTRIDNEWVLLKGGKARTFKIPLHIYSGQELRHLLAEAGFGEVKLYGDLEGGEYGLGAGRLVAVARKPLKRASAKTAKAGAQTPAARQEELQSVKQELAAAQAANRDLKEQVSKLQAEIVALKKAAESKPRAAVHAPPHMQAAPIPPKAAAPAAAKPTMMGRILAAARGKAATKKPEGRPWWHNCGPADEEMLDIDGMEERISPLDEETKRIRMLITRLKLWHCDAERHVGLILESIGKGEAVGAEEITRGAVAHKEGQMHPAEKTWRSYVDILGAWCMGNVSTVMYLDTSSFGGVNPLEILGMPAPLKTWQVRQILDRVRAASGAYPTAEYVPMMGNRDRYMDQAEFYDATEKTMIHDEVDGRSGEISLAEAIDELDPWHWNFAANILIVLEALAGNLRPDKPYAAGTRNIRLSPIRKRMQVVSTTLQAFLTGVEKGGEDRAILKALGESTPARNWLVASLDKTLRAQLLLP
ncbi:MAG: methyltransferase domain-containing protein [Kiritimatiellae bacterium]|nr:methyltransferase domain-containing protein [Kiritimatiellia bacterium]